MGLKPSKVSKLLPVVPDNPQVMELEASHSSNLNEMLTKYLSTSQDNVNTDDDLNEVNDFEEATCTSSRHHYDHLSSLKIPDLQNRFSVTSIKQVGLYRRSHSYSQQIDLTAQLVNPSEYVFHFENLVFEGGGNKGLAYCGTVRYLEEIKLMDTMKRFAGTSVGGMMATLLAAGYSSYDIEQFLNDRMDKLILDAKCGYCSLLPNFIRNFGWNPGLKIYDWLGDKLHAKTGNADITFREFYHRFNKEICIVVTNLSQMTIDYCHPKTTPQMPIRMAVRMSMAIPGLFFAIKYEILGETNVYVDGGVLCSYPVHCFDGWFLSMAPEDSFVRRMQTLRDLPLFLSQECRFGTINERTIGVMLYSDCEDDTMRFELEQRAGCLEPREPKKNTKLFNQRKKEEKMQARVNREHSKVEIAADAFLKVIIKHNVEQHDSINRQELEAAFADNAVFPTEYAEMLFGKDVTVDKAFEILDRDKDGQIRFDDLLWYIEKMGLCLQTRFYGYRHKEIKNLTQFLNVLQNTFLYNMQRLYVQDHDLDRTVGINTGHVTTTDFKMEEADREFVVLRGYNSMRCFLQYYVAKHPDKVLKRVK